MVATLRQGHFETANFEGLMLEVDDPATLVAGDRLEATGFFSPGFSGTGPRPVGYSGPRLRALSVRKL